MSKAFSFILGAAVGAIATWVYAKHYYEGAYCDEIFYKAEDEAPRDEVAAETENEEEAKDETANQDGAEITIPGVEERAKEEDPVVIPIEEFGYSKTTATWSFYSDNIMVDDMGDIISDEEWKKALGTEWRGMVETCVEGELYVRNSRRQCDYQIVLIDAPYDDV